MLRAISISVNVINYCCGSSLQSVERMCTCFFCALDVLKTGVKVFLLITRSIQDKAFDWFLQLCIILYIILTNTLDAIFTSRGVACLAAGNLYYQISHS